MSLPNLLYFYRRRLRVRLVQELLALAGIAVGVALLFSVQVANTSLNASIVQLTHRFAGAAQLQLDARDSHGLSETTVEEVRRLPGVRAAAPVLIVQANAIGRRGNARALTLFAADPGFARLGGDLLSAFTSGELAGIRAVVLPLAIAQDLDVRFGDTITLQLGSRSVPAPVGAIVGRHDVGPLADSPTLVTSLAFGQQLAGSGGRVSRVYVVPEPGRLAAVAAGLRRIAGNRLDVRPADADARVFAQAAGPNNQSTGLFAAISALVGFLFAFNTLLLLARERRGVIAELRMSGFGLAAILEVLVFDALVLGIVASLVGLALGDQLSRHVFQPSPGYLTLAFPVDTARVVHWQTVALALGSGVLAAVLATVSPLLGVFSQRAVDAVEDDAIGRPEQEGLLHSWRLLVGGIGCLAITTLVLIAAPQAPFLGIATLIASMLLTLPAVLGAVLGIAYRVRRRARSAVPLIAIGELRSAGSRSVALAGIAAIAVFGSTAIEGAHRDLQRALNTDSRELDAGPDLWVSAAGESNVLATVPFRPDAATALRRLPEVAAVRIYRGGFLDLGTHRVWVLGPPRATPQPIPPSQLVQGDLVLARARIRGHGWAVVSQGLAAQRHLRVGSSFTLASPRPARFRVAAIGTNLGWSPGAVIVNAGDYRAAWGSSDASALHVVLAHGVSPAQGKVAVQRALGPRSALAVETTHEREGRQQAASRAGLARLTQIARLVLIAAALAMAAAMGGMIWQRRHRLADLKLVGIDHRRLWQALLLESALLLSIGCVLGAIYGLFGEQLLDRTLHIVTGFPVDNSIGVRVAAVSLAVVTGVATAVAMLPGYLAARVPADAAFQD